MKVAKQLLKEFWLPFFGAMIWTLYNDHTKLASAIASFGSAFFLLSYFTSQLFRVKKQTATEATLKAIRSDIKDLLDDLKLKTDDLIGHVTGGDSFCETRTYVETDSYHSRLGFIHHGTHPLYDLRIRVTDINIFNEVIKANGRNLESSDIVLTSISLLLPGHVHAVPAPIAIRENKYSLNVFFQARNGVSVQELRGALVGDKWVTASRITQGHEDSKICFEQIDDLFPRNASGDVEWN